MSRNKDQNREYMRVYMRGRRRKAQSDRSMVRCVDINPFTGEVFEFWGSTTQTAGVGYALSKRHLMEGMEAWNQAGYTLHLGTEGYEPVNLETGEIGLGGQVESLVHQQQPTFQEVKERLESVERAITEHQLEHILDRTLDSRDGLGL